MNRVMIFLLALVLALFHLPASALDLRVGTWNLMRLGDGGQKSYEAAAAIAGKVDLLAIQEVMNEEGIARLEQAVEARTGEPWSVITSSPAGSALYKESYSFLSRDSAVVYDEGAVSYLDRKRVFIREPFSAKFRSTKSNETLILATVHIIYGKGPQDRVEELQELARYWTWLQEVYPGEEILLTGDFNMPPQHPAFAGLTQYAVPAVTMGATTLSHTNGRFANLYDNIFVPRGSKLKITAVRVVDFPSMLKITHEQARKHVSDHAPVFMQLGNARLQSGVLLVPQHQAAPARVTPVESVAKLQGRVAANDPWPGTGPVHGNRNSRIYHLSAGCPSYSAISPHNLVLFESEAQAQQANYRKAKNCS